MVVRWGLMDLIINVEEDNTTDIQFGRNLYGFCWQYSNNRFF